MIGLAEHQPLADKVEMQGTTLPTITPKSNFTKLTNLTNITKPFQFFSFPTFQGEGSFLTSTPIFLI